MNNRNGIGLRTLVGAALALLAFAANAAIDQAEAEALLDRIGVTRQLEPIPAMLSVMLEQSQQQPDNKVSKEVAQDLAQHARRWFTVKHLRDNIVEATAATLERSDIALLDAWYGSKTGKKISRLEEDTIRQAVDGAKERERGERALARASAERRALLDELDRAVRGTELTADISVNMGTGIAYGISTALGSMPGISFTELRKLVAKELAPMRDEIARSTILSFAATYEPLSDEELGAYVKVNQTAQGKKLSEAGFRGLDKAFVTWSVRFGQDFAGKAQRSGS